MFDSVSLPLGIPVRTTAIQGVLEGVMQSYTCTTVNHVFKDSPYKIPSGYPDSGGITYYHVWYTLWHGLTKYGKCDDV